MSMRIIVCLLLSLLFSLKAEDQLECRNSKCFCYTVKEDKEGRIWRCSDKLYQQNLSMIQNWILAPKHYRGMSAFPYLELDIRHLSYFGVNIFYIDCFSFNLEHNSTANTTLFDLIPKLNLHAIESLILNQCPFPEEPFQVLFDILNVTKVNDFRILYPTSTVRLSDFYFEGIPPLTSIIFTGKGYEPSVREMSYEDPFGKGTTIIDKNLYALDPNVFQHLRNLKRLQIEGYNITTLDPSMFGNLTSLEYLIIYSNQIENLTGDLFTNLLNLEVLDISHNKISVLPSGIFDDLGNLREFNAEGNKFQAFPPDLFSKTKRLDKIYLNYNGSLPPGFLSNLPNLQEVVLQDNHILKELPQDLFWNSPNLKKLYLRGHTKLTHIPRELFRDSRKISKLDLSNNGLHDLEENTFEFIKELADLDLSHNQLNNITNDIFSRRDIKRSLEHLNLSHNKLKSISEPEFDPCKNNKYALHSIDLSHNILELDSHLEHSPFNECKELQTLKLSNNRINKIYKDWILNMPSLATLDLKSNNITMMPNYDYGDYNNLFRSSKMILDISYNQIEVIEWRFLKLLSQRRKNKIFRNKIVLNGNPIACNCSNYDLLSAIQNLTIDKVAVLQKIAIETQNVTCKPGNISIDRVHPREITCSPVEGCPSSCHCIHAPYHNETTVNCSSAKLKQIPPELNMTYEGKIASKIRLILTNNSIQELPQNSPDMYKIVTDLDLSFNEISHWETDNLFHLLRLKQLNISHNRLGSLNQDVINLLSSSNISSLSLSGNPWACDCDNITRLYNFVWTKQFIIKDSKQITCNGEAKPLLEVNRNNLCSSNKHQQIVVTSIIMGSLGILFGLLVLLYYKYQNEIKVWLFAHGLLQWCVSQEDIDTDKVYDAFVSYASEDYGFVVHSLLPELDNSFRICHHERDFIGGEWIHIQIEEKVQQSRRTIIVLTEEFLNSYWGMTEFRVAYAQSLKDNCARIIILILRDMPPQDAIPDEMKLYMSMNTYIKWGDKWFWDKLKFALPHPPAKTVRDSAKYFFVDKP
uniref:Protein toll n=1 Tax=Cacopsylla melanoneura TaxID=428564 RepID=A0A8D8UDR6_9HEMI